MVIIKKMFLVFQDVDGSGYNYLVATADDLDEAECIIDDAVEYILQHSYTPDQEALASLIDELYSSYCIVIRRDVQ